MPRPDRLMLSDLRAMVSAVEAEGRHEKAEGGFRIGLPTLDEVLGGGLARGALHEVYARSAMDAAATAGFGLGLAARAAEGRALLWARQDFAGVEAGELYGDGCAAFGLDPRKLLVVRARNPTDVLRAALEAARCAALGAALVEVWGEPKLLDLKASRRLSLAAGGSGVTLVMVRLGADPAPSAAATRWSVAAAASAPLEADAPGRPAFVAALLRHRAGARPGEWRLEWNRDSASFQSAPLPRAVAAVPSGRTAAAERAGWRLAG